MATIPGNVINHKKLSDWIERVKLISVLGPEKYQCVKKFCFTAKHFIKKSKDDDAFKEKLKKHCDIDNPEEIAELLETRKEKGEKGAGEERGGRPW